jgi:hypothetical protein
MKTGCYFGNFGASPCDRQMGKKERAAQFGLSENLHDESFECNQSFPRAIQSSKSKFKPSECDITHARGCELNSVNFLKTNFLKNNLSMSSRANARRHLLNDTTLNRSSAPAHNNTSFMSQNGPNHSNIFDKSWMFYNQFANSNMNLAGESGEEDLLTINNPNKALVVINGRTTEILTANDISCDLFGYNDGELIGMKLKDLLDLSENEITERKEALMETDKLDQNGRVVLCSGKIFDAYCLNPLQNNPDQPKEEKLKIPVSIYMLKLTDEQEPRCLCVMEPIQRIVGTFTINFKV